MYHILICDDQPDIVNALKIYLAPEGYTLFEAFNGREAVEIARREEVHLILLDIMMPVMDGITAAAKIREKSNVPIIFLSAKSEDSDKILGLNIGADDYITKPFNPIEVTARVRSQLRRYFTLGGREQTPERIVIGGLEIDDIEKKFLLDGDEVVLHLDDRRMFALAEEVESDLTAGQAAADDDDVVADFFFAEVDI